jgi:hypothetical protein
MIGRRLITIVLEPNGEINRAWCQDEISNADTSVGYTPAVNVSEETLAGLLPDHASVLSQVETAVRARDDALTAASAALAERDARVAEVAALATANAALEAQIAELTAPPATARTYMSDLWRRATDEESGVIEAIIASLSPKQRNLLNSVTYLDHADPQFPDIVAALTQAFGVKRAGELLAASA